MVFPYDIKQDLTGKVAVVSGGNRGIGKVTCLKLAAKGCHIIICARDEQSTKQVVDEIKQQTNNQKIDFVKLDLSSLQSVKEAANTVLALNLPIHLLINNAGVAGNRSLSKDGYEITFATNHLGHFLWTLLLLDKVKSSAPARIINVSSMAHYKGMKYNWDQITSSDWAFNTLRSYQDSKLANILHIKSLAKQLEGTGVTTYALHPGVIATDIWRYVPWPIRGLMKRAMLSEEDGALTTLYCATEPSISKDSGKYYDDCKEKEPQPLANDEQYANELWEKSMDLIKQYLD